MILPEKKQQQKGFTLVEVIVVAIIVAAMAAVVVPLYLGYVENSRKNSAANAAGSIASFAGACINSGGALTPATGQLGATLSCNNNTSIQIPVGITLTLTAGGDPDGAGPLPATTRGVTGFHNDYPTGIVTYNF